MCFLCWVYVWGLGGAVGWNSIVELIWYMLCSSGQQVEFQREERAGVEWASDVWVKR